MVGLFFPVFLLRGPIRKSGSWRSAAIVLGYINVGIGRNPFIEGFKVT
jgi:hypothetical protein